MRPGRHAGARVCLPRHFMCMCGAESPIRSFGKQRTVGKRPIKRTMQPSDMTTQLRISETEIRDPSADFATRYTAVFHLLSLAGRRPDILGTDTIAVLESLLRERTYAGQRRGLFLFRLAAEALAAVIVNSGDSVAVRRSLAALERTLRSTTGTAHRVTAETLGALPFDLAGPGLDVPVIGSVPAVSWQRIASLRGLTTSGPPSFFGRSMVVPIKGDNRLLVFKLARPDDVPAQLAGEAIWMEYLQSWGHAGAVRFTVPEMLRVAGCPLCRLTGLPEKARDRRRFHPENMAICFITPPDYYIYPNDPPGAAAPPVEAFSEIMLRNAWLLGRLTGAGIVHSAPIPLFHNRVQRHRRRDNGRYEWYRAGRLDRWLDSCAYPNVGVTGIRDFEHLVSLQRDNGNLYRHMGMHLLSLLLIAGSYFRNRDPERVGVDAAGRPVDARDLFDARALVAIVTGIFHRYHAGFTGYEFSGSLPFAPDHLVGRMIEEMGVDRHMEEILRVPDQQEMTDQAFRSFLKDRGYSERRAASQPKGVAEITIRSGPHLGGFNDTISLPELIEAVAAMAATCIAGRYWRESM